MIHVFTPAEFDGINSNLTIETIDDCFLYVSYKNYKKVFEIETESYKSKFAGLYWPDGAKQLILYLKEENKNESRSKTKIILIYFMILKNQMKREKRKSEKSRSNVKKIK